LRSAADTVRPLTRRDTPAVLTAVLAAALIALPIAMLVVRSLQTPAGWGLDNYRNLASAGEHNVLLVPGTTALANSLSSALIAAALSVAVGVTLCVVLARRPVGRIGRRVTAAL